MTIVYDLYGNNLEQSKRIVKELLYQYEEIKKKFLMAVHGYPHWQILPSYLQSPQFPMDMKKNGFELMILKFKVPRVKHFKLLHHS